MTNEESAPLYRVWGIDNVAYGPVELPTLVSWIKDGRVLPDNWVFIESENAWKRAKEISELKMLFDVRPQENASGRRGEDPDAVAGLRPGSLRRVKILADMEQKQLESFLKYMEIEQYKQFAYVVRQGEHGEAMFLVLEGELRACVTIDGKESTLTTLPAGDFFGELSLLDHGPRSADVIANQPSVLLKISTTHFDRLCHEAPALAAPFLYNLNRSVAGRLRNLTKRYQDSVHFSRAAAQTK